MASCLSTSPEKYTKDPIKTLEINFMGTLNVLKLARTNNAKLLLASSSEIYGDPEIHPQDESYKGSVNTLGQRSCYVEGKRIAETLCHNYANKHLLDIKIARILIPMVLICFLMMVVLLVILFAVL